MAGAEPAPPLTVTGAVGQEGFRGHVAARLDPDGGLGIAEVADSPGALVPAAGGIVDFGYTTAAIWLRIDLLNRADAPPVTDWRLHVRENFFQEFAAWVLYPDGRLVLLEDQDETSGFASRRIAHPELVTGFDLPPEEAAAVFIRYRSGGASDISFRLIPRAEFDAFADSRTARNFVFYGMMLLLVIAALGMFAVVRAPVFLAYAAYALTGLLFIMHFDGNTFRYLWPNAPVFNAFASIPLGAGIIVAGAQFARQFLQTAEHHRFLDLLLRLAIAAALLALVASSVADHQTIKKLLVLGSFLSVLLFLFCGIVAARTRFREVRFFLLAWAGAVISSAIMTGRHWFGLEISEEVQFNSMRVVFVVDAAMMGFAIIDRINQIRRAHNTALETALEAAERNLALSNRLMELERRHEDLTGRAARTERRMADTAHDLRQPLHALRLNVQNLARPAGAGAAPGGTLAEIEETFTYLESLVAEELARNDAPVVASGAGVAVGSVTSAVVDMFQADAEARGLALRDVPSAWRCGLPPLVLMRLASNLVSNAVKYTDAGGVLIGLRRGGSPGPRLEVHDTGPGLTREALDLARGRKTRLGMDPQTPEGSGLGLSIVAGIAAEHGLRFGLVEGRRGGTGLYVTLPGAD